MKSSLSCRLKNVPYIKSSLMNKSLERRASLERSWYLSENKKTITGQAAKLLFICVLIFSKSIECVEAFRSDRASPGEPCICNSTFYKSCPTDPHCEEDTKIDSDLNKGQDRPRPFNPRNGISHGVARHTVADDYHDYDDPDHVDAGLPIFGDEIPRQPRLSSLSKTSSLDTVPERDPFVMGSIRSQPVAPPKEEVKFNDGEKKVVRHRKVYVRTGNDDPVIHPLRVTIPVEVEYPQDIPTPKPVYKLKKYTTYEEKSEIKMVPVIKTIIKPANVTPDQIIE